MRDAQSFWGFLAMLGTKAFRVSVGGEPFFNLLTLRITFGSGAFRTRFFPRLCFSSPVCMKGCQVPQVTVVASLTTGGKELASKDHTKKPFSQC